MHSNKLDLSNNSVNSEENVIAEQRAFFERLSTVWSTRASEKIQSDTIRLLLLQLAENVLLSGVLDWSRPKPLVNWSIARWYVRGLIMAKNLYGVIGIEAADYAQKDLAEDFKIGYWENNLKD